MSRVVLGNSYFNTIQPLNTSLPERLECTKRTKKGAFTAYQFLYREPQ